MTNTKWCREAVHLLVALVVVLAMVLVPLVPQGSPLSNVVGPGVALANGVNVVNITSPTTNNSVCVQPGGSLTVNWTYNTNCTSVCFSIKVDDGTNVIFENTAVNRTGLAPGVDNPFNETITINTSAPANCNWYNLTIIAGCPVLPIPPEDTEVNAIRVDNVTPTVNLTAPQGDICIHENNVTVTANVSDDCCLANVTFWYDVDGAGWNFIGYNNTGQGSIYSVVWDTSGLDCAKNVTINATATDCCNNTFSDTVGNITIDHTLPVVTITSPTVDSCVSENLTVSANVTDNCTCVDNVTFEYSLDGANWTQIGFNDTSCSANTTCTRSVPWNTTALGADYCNVTIRANATDCCGNTNSTTVGNITINNAEPTVSWNYPVNNDCVNGTVTLNATAGGAPNVTRVDFYYSTNGGGSWTSIGNDTTDCPCNTTCTYTQAWNTTPLSDACNVTLRAMATDWCNVTYNATVTNITINNAVPTVSWNYPTNNTCVNDTVTLNVTAGGAPNVTNVEFFYLLEGGSWTSIGNDTTDCPCNTTCIYTQAWNTTPLSDACNVTLRAMATDWCGVTNNATVGNITINNDDPYVNLTAPAEGSCVSGIITLNATAGGAPNVTNVTFWWRIGSGNWTFIGYDNTDCACGGSCNYSVSWNTTANIPCACNVTINATATDWCGQTNSSVYDISIDNSGQGPVITNISPQQDECIEGNYTVSANVSDNCTCVNNVTFEYFNGTAWNPIGQGYNNTNCTCNTTCNYTIIWNTTTVPDMCNVTVRINATDCCSYNSSATVTNITINNYPPTVNLTAPAEGSCVHGNVTLNATAGGAPNVTNVTFWWRIGSGNWTFIGYNNTVCPCNTTYNYSVSWNTTLVPDSCNVTINATAEDWCGKTNSSYYDVIVHNVLNAPVRSSPLTGVTIWQNNVTFNWTVPGVVVNPTYTLVIFEKNYPTNTIIQEITRTGCEENQTITTYQTLFDDYWGWYVNVTDTCGEQTLTNSTFNTTNPNWIFEVHGGYEGPTVAVNVPNGGETWEAGSNHTITWSATDDTPGELSIDIYYSSDGGTNWTSIATGEENDGAYLWTVPSTPGCQYLVKVTATDANDFMGSDTSNDVFCIVAALQTTITVEVSAPSQPVLEGTNFTVTALIKNTGGTAASNVTVTMNATGAVTPTSEVKPVIASIAAGDSVNKEFTLQCTGETDANVVVTAVGTNTNIAQDSAAVTQIAITEPYLVVEVSAPSQPVLEGTNFTVTALIKNIGGTAASNVTVTMNATGAVTPTSEVKPVISSIAAGDSVNKEFTLQCTGETDANVVVTAVGTNTNIAQDSAAVTQIAITEPYLVVEVSAPSQPVLEGTNFTVTALIKNIGGTAASNVTATMNATGAVTPASEIKPVITSIAAGDSVNKEFTLQCTGETDANVVVTAVGTNTNIAQDSAAVTQIAITEPYLVVEVSAPSQPVLEGTNFTVTALIKNIGGTAASNVTATMNATGAVTPASEIKPVITSIAAGDSVNKEFTLQCTGETDANVVVTAVGTNTNIAQDSAAVTQIAITEPYLVVEVSAPSQPVLEGTNFTVTALIKNIGGTAASNVTATMNATGAVTPASEIKPVITSIAAGDSVNREFALQCTGETDANVVVTAVGTNTNIAQDSAAVTQIAITADITEPTVTVNRPNGGESWVGGSNETITWTATDDKTPSANLVINLTYSSDGGVNWTSIATGEQNDGAYLWTVPSINSSLCLVKVVATDAVGNSGFDVSDDTFTITTPGAATTTIQLYEGWNLISPMLYIPTGNRTPATLLASVLGNVYIVWGDYDPANGTWKSYIPAGPSSLTEIRDGKGYWINMTAADTLNLSALGSELPDPPEVPPSYNVVEGWNLIGFKSTTSKLASEYLAAIDGKYTVIYGYNAAADIYFTVQSGDSLQPGYGYWIAITEAGTIFP